MSYRNIVKIITYTWGKDSHGLFDYESSQLFQKNFKLSNDVEFYRNGNDIQMVEEGTQDPSLDPINYLFDVRRDPTNTERFYFTKKENINSIHGPGIVVRGLKKEGQASGYELKVGDYIKFGRLKIIVREIQDHQNARQKDQVTPHVGYYTKNKDSIEEENSNVGACRICLLEDASEDPLENKLIKPCKCRGSCEHVHLTCLKQWIRTNQTKVETVEENICQALNCRKLSCEICKTNLPYSIKVDDQEINLVDLQRPENEPYILLEKVDESHNKKVFYLIKSTKEEIKIGRGHSNHIHISDISVSRNHACINFQDGKFMLFDKNSKFGTIVHFSQPLEISNDRTMIQCGKTVAIFCLRKEFVMDEVKVIQEPMEIIESPETSSTTNEAEAEIEPENEVEVEIEVETERSKRFRQRAQKREGVRYSETMEPKYEEDLYDQNSMDGGLSRGSTLLRQSKKIFKIEKSGSRVEDDTEYTNVNCVEIKNRKKRK